MPNLSNYAATHSKGVSFGSEVNVIKIGLASVVPRNPNQPTAPLEAPQVKLNPLKEE